MNGSALFRFDEKLKSKFSPSLKTFCLVGIDEAGRGPLAGPVVACAVALPEGFFDVRLDDSKKLSPSTRLDLYKKIKAQAFWGISVGQVSLIDSVNILSATHQSMLLALKNLLTGQPHIQPDLVAVDGRPVPPSGFPQISIVKGDTLSASIAAASVMAKVFRDRIMSTLETRFPGYGLARHKGYGTLAHQERLAKLGPSPVHRKSFAPVRNWLNPGFNAN